MPRRRPAEQDDVSLFPFLSIIAAVIGVLTLMIAAVAIGQMNQEDVQEAVKNSIEMAQVTKALAENEDGIKALKLQLSREQAATLNSNAARDAELVKTQAELEALIKQLANTRKKVEEQKQVKIVIPEIPQGQRETITDMQGQLQRIKQRLATLEKELTKRKSEQEAEVSILPGGTGLSFEPSFIECSASSIVMHTEDPPLRIRTNEVAANKTFVALLNRVANNNKQTVVFLIRSDGLSTYRSVRSLCDANGVRNGKLPVVGNGRLDFSHFRK